MEELSWFISNLSIYSIALPAVVGLVFYHRLLLYQKAIFLLIVLSLGTDLAARLVIENEENHQYVYRIFTIVEFILLTYVFAQGIKPFVTKGVFLSLGISFLSFALVDLLWISDLEEFNTYTTAVEGILMIVFALAFFYKTLTELKIKELEKSPFVWLSIGVLLYFSSSLFIFLFTNYFEHSQNSLFIIWGIHGIFSILLNITYSIILWIKPAK
ncbi:MAG: hypothetical protein KTR30_16535 [Saprospiraceae bacterium]|nr:hypothetical protein [Saprospiraceae bacterium]